MIDRLTLRHATALITLLALLIMVPDISASNGQMPGQAIIKVKNNGEAHRAGKRWNATVIDSIPSINTYLLSFSDDYEVTDVVEGLEQNPEVVFATVNAAMELPEVDQISQAFPDQKKPIFIKGELPLSYYEAPDVYATGIDSAHIVSTAKGITVAVIDNGLDFTHPLIQSSRTKFGYDFVSDDIDATEEPGLLYGHGTFVTGLVLLTAPECIVMPIRAFDGDGVGDMFAVAQALYWAIDHRASVVNMSFGIDTSDPVLETAINDAVAAGIALVASSGNDAANLETYPAAYPGVIAVTSIGPDEILAEFANWGYHVDLCAPGVNLYSALPGEYQWGTWSGTSFSAPLVTGTVAMVFDVNRDIEPEAIENYMRFTGRTELAWGTITPPDEYYGFGVLDAYLAVTAYVVGDMDADGERTEDDLGILIGHVGKSNGIGWGSPRFRRKGDINCDGFVNIIDVAAFIHYMNSNWEGYCPCYR